jgi:carboxyl-terminal processing protease
MNAKRNLLILLILPLTLIITSVSASSQSNTVNATVAKDTTRLSQDEFFKKIGKSFDILGAVYKELAINYLIDVDPEVLMRKAIDGMLADLDPYTVYYDKNDETLSDRLEGEEYVGFGIRVAYIDSNIFVSSVRNGFGADQAGFRPGDIIKSVDGKELYGISSDSLSNYTRGEIGTVSQVVLLRDNQEIPVVVERMSINDPAVSYSTLLNDSIAYIALNRFSRGSADELRKTLRNLDKTNPLSGFILDLRGNGGGLLSEAVSIVETFVGKNTDIVSTKGRFDINLQSYKSASEPEFEDLSIAVIIDEQSASASEVVSGAIQDLDRGIVIGRPSFGKGLVQSYANLPFGAKLKITTANYFTPSGRSIQKLDIEKLVLDRDSFADDTTVYTTANGRIISDHHGILPDTIVDYSELPDEYLSILNSRYIFNHLVRNLDGRSKYGLNNKLPEEYILSMIDSLEFTDILYGYPQLSNLDYTIIDSTQSLELEYDNLIQMTKQSALEATKEKLKSEIPLISDLVKTELMRQNLKLEEYRSYAAKKDNMINTAIKLLTTDDYLRMLNSDFINAEANTDVFEQTGLDKN